MQLTRLLFTAALTASCASPKPEIVAPEATPVAADPVGPDDTKDTVAPNRGEEDERVGHFVRYDLVTADAAKAKTFYAGLFGWTLEASEGGAISNGGVEIGRVHLASNTKLLEPGWVAYIAVRDVDDVAVDVVGNGGAVVKAAAATNGSREAIVRGPTGGAFGLRGLTDSDEVRGLGQRQGEIYWAQLWTTDLAAALTFFQVIGEYTSNEFRFGAVRYQVFKASDGAPVGAVVNAPAGQRNQWLPFVRVDDIDDTLAKAKRLGAKVVTKPREIAGIGRLASIATPSGGVIGVIAVPEEDSTLDE